MARNERADLAMIRDSSEWPQLVLPLKRYHRDKVGWDAMETALLLRPVRSGPVTIYRGNLFNAQAIDFERDKIEYASPEAVVLDGWEVD